MTKCVIYSRVSTNEQDNLSQIEDLKKYAKSNNLNVVQTFGEKVSGYDLTKERLEYDNMKVYVVKNNIKTVLIWELSRLGRSTLQTLKEIDFFSKNGINIFFKKENLNTLSDNATNKLLLNLLSSIAELERSTIVDRSHRGMVSSAEQGKRIGFSIVPYGYEADKNGYVIVKEEEAKVVRAIYKMYTEGSTVRGIAMNLNSRGVPTKYALMGKKRTLRNGNVVDILWQNASVQKILKGTIYKGERNFGGKIKVSLPAIVTEEQWNKVQERFKSHISYINRTKYEYIFKGKITCGHCGRAYITRTETRYPNKPSYYICSGRVDPGIKCKSGQFTSKVVDEIIYDFLFRHASVMLKVYKDKRSDFDIDTMNKQIEFFRSEIVTRESKKKRIIYLYKEGLLSDSELKSEQSAIRNEVVDIQNKISQIEREINDFSGVDLSGTLMTLLRSEDFNVKREFVQKYVDKILIYNVEHNDIDFTNLSYTIMKTMKTNKLQKPRKDEKIKYIEVFAFGSQTPMKVVLSSFKNICFTSDKLEYKEGTLTI